MLGYFVLQTYVSPKQRQYQLDFGNAQWIEAPEVAPVAYFRTEVFLSSAPEQAWIEIAAAPLIPAPRSFSFAASSKSLVGA